MTQLTSLGNDNHKFSVRTKQQWITTRNWRQEESGRLEWQEIRLIAQDGAGRSEKIKVIVVWFHAHDLFLLVCFKR